MLLYSSFYQQHMAKRRNNNLPWRPAKLIFGIFWVATNCFHFKNENVVNDRSTYYAYHSSEIRGLHSTKCSSETFQNLLYFMYKKTQVIFFVFHFVQLYILTYECPGLCQRWNISLSANLLFMKSATVNVFEPLLVSCCCFLLSGVWRFFTRKKCKI